MRRLNVLIVLVLGLTLAESGYGQRVWTQEPQSFVGIPFNASKDEAVMILAGRQQKFDLCGKSSDGGTFCAGSLLRIADTDLELILSFYKDDKLGSITGQFPSEEFDTIRDIFVQKYGQPHSEEKHEVQTGTGAKYTNQTLRWIGMDLDILLEKYGSKITQGLFGLTLHSVTEAERKSREDAKKKAADTL